jgi:hypothetical protein
VRQGGEFCQRAALGVVEQLAHRGDDGVAAVTRDERLHAPRTGRVGGDLRTHVAARLVLGANLRQHELEDVRHDPAARDQPDRWDDHAFLEDLAERSDARRRPAADVDVVRDVRDVADQLAVGVHGGDQADVVQVHAARVRIVREQHVAGPEPVGAVGEDRLRHLLDHRAEVDGLREPLRHRTEPGVEERRREVGACLDVRRVGAAPEREHHLVRRGHERVADDLERYGVHAYTFSARARLILPSRTSRATASRARSSGGP